MESASFEGLLKTILYFVAFYYAFKFIARLLLPVLVKKVVDKASENLKQQKSYQNKSASSEEEMLYGSVKSKKPPGTKNVGEYVDYEEIE